MKAFWAIITLVIIITNEQKQGAERNRTEMKKVLCFLCFSLQLLILADFASRSPPPHRHRPFAGEITESPAAVAVVDSKIGSSPPRCVDKCDGCIPCVPVEVPAITNSGGSWGPRHHRDGGIHVQYTIYEPEGWKCKCGPSLYIP
ncbi:hypothetical protein MLD38_004819 [Melastoma candidum]|uniref:Uncharacterized protein n=1 Tax=Melastoma candidum TaxID=119954 RepID=A0ACB9SA85_9MYRT|nr:hypothetical protein MLD38_004819 [Melastoma candidum]